MGERDGGVMEEGYPYPAAQVPLRSPELSPGKGMPMGRAPAGVQGRKRQKQEMLPDLLPVQGCSSQLMAAGRAQQRRLCAQELLIGNGWLVFSGNVCWLENKVSSLYTFFFF